MVKTTFTMGANLKSFELTTTRRKEIAPEEEEDIKTANGYFEDSAIKDRTLSQTCSIGSPCILIFKRWTLIKSFDSQS